MKARGDDINRYEFVNMLKSKGHKKIYLSHEEDIESEKDARDIVPFLKNNGIIALVGADYRKFGRGAVREAIESCDAVISYNLKAELGMG